MRTYSHAELTQAAGFAPPSTASAAARGRQERRSWTCRRSPVRRGPPSGDTASTGSGCWGEVCARRLFSGPDAVLHSALPAHALLLAFWISGTSGRGPRGSLLAFLVGWMGHVLAEALTHAEEAGPILRPGSRTASLRSPDRLG